MKEMRDYIITVNSTVDMPKEWLAERGVPVIPLKYTNGRKNLYRYGRPDTKRVLWQTQRRKDVCDVQVNPEEAKENVRAVCERRKDVLHLSFLRAERNCQ